MIGVSVKIMIKHSDKFIVPEKKEAKTEKTEEMKKEEELIEKMADEAKEVAMEVKEEFPAEKIKEE